MKKKYFDIFILATAIVCIIFSLHNYYGIYKKDKFAAENSKVILEETVDFIENEVIEETQEKEVQEKETQEKETVVSTGRFHASGTLEFPTLSLKLPVIDSYSDEKVQYAPCTYKGKAGEHFVICAHSYRSQFGKLKGLNVGDTVTFTDTQNVIYQYKVRNCRVIKENDFQALFDGDLVLFTCTNDGKKRILITCDEL